MGTETRSLAGSLSVCYELNDAMYSILVASDMCFMVATEHLACVVPLDEQKVGLLVFGLIGIILTRDFGDQYRTTFLEYVAYHVNSLAEQ